VTSAAFSPDGHWLVSGSEDGTARLWDASALSVVGEDTARQAGSLAIEASVLRGHTDKVTSVAFSPDSRWLATGSWDQTIRLWDISAMPQGALQSGGSETDPWVLRGHEGRVTSVAVSPDGHWLASGGGGWEQTARLWDLSALPPPGGAKALNTGPEAELPVREVRELRGHTAAISSVTFSPDGRWLATGSLDDTARLWDLWALLAPTEDKGPSTDQGTEDPSSDPVVLSGHKDNVAAVAFSPDERWLATGSLDTTVRLWRMRLEELIAAACQTAGRNLTQDEWAQYFRGEEYRRTCESLPAYPSVITTERTKP
jgi:WD40 repeat protein